VFGCKVNFVRLKKGANMQKQTNAAKVIMEEEEITALYLRLSQDDDQAHPNKPAGELRAQDG